VAETDKHRIERLAQQLQRLRRWPRRGEFDEGRLNESELQRLNEIDERFAQVGNDVTRLGTDDLIDAEKLLLLGTAK
jgi:hypothetical protein